MKIVECQNLCKSFDNKKVLVDINLNIEAGKIIGLLGKNGSGKTTLLKLINDLLTPTSGQVLIKNQKPGIDSKKIISYLPERHYLDSNMTVKNIIKYFADFYDDFNTTKAYDLLEKLAINSNDKLSTMSKGTKEKVNLILVMSRKADLYVLDEPIGGVDPATRDYILNTILNNFADNASIILSTHLIADVERILDEVVFIDNGKIVLQADADQLRTKRKKSIDEIFREEFKC